MIGFILDVQNAANGTSIDVWLVDDAHVPRKINLPWCPSLHVHASRQRLSHLWAWLEQPEIRDRFGLGLMRSHRSRLSLDASEIDEVLEIDVHHSWNLRKVAAHIEARGGHQHYTLYSVDAHLTQRFLVEHKVAPFQRVVWAEASFEALETPALDPTLGIVHMAVMYSNEHGFHSEDASIERIEFRTCSANGACDSSVEPSQMLTMGSFSTKAEFLSALENLVSVLDPDVIMTDGGDGVHFPALMRMAASTGVILSLSRDGRPLAARTSARTLHSYGQTLHKDGYIPLYGRLHIDRNGSFIVREGGLQGLFELARHSQQSPQDISRLSPGSVISAIQMRTAMEDGVLVPWKKNRPEDTKTAWALLHADRGGLYLDSQPGVYEHVIELDFASLFPSIIATRNISTETLNCPCCQAMPPSHLLSFVPLHPQEAEHVFAQRHTQQHFGAGLFPIQTSDALPVPGLNSHTCGRIHGFLGRIVAPLIERRRQLKKQIQEKGDSYDQQQNALKWLLVTCFGYTGYKNARFGRIEAHEAICAWARDILLDTIAMAEEDGWEVLHAIVDCVWIQDRRNRTPTQRVVDAHAFAARVTQTIGIPLEYEDIYQFIGFVPSRVHGAGSLTKYWAYGQHGFKMRGIEERQHSTCAWVANMQRTGLQLLVEHSNEVEGIPSLTGQSAVAQHFLKELGRLERNEVDLRDLVEARRITRNLEDFDVETLAYAALLRGRLHGLTIPPGGKIRFAVVAGTGTVQHERVILLEELTGTSQRTERPHLEHYQSLALRAMWAVLAPFGWDEEELQVGRKRVTLNSFPGFS
jgi:DNA polymerase I